MNMIERVAQAINEELRKGILYRQDERCARAAIAAMREPDEQILHASRLWHGQHYVSLNQWQAMIDAALGGK